MVENSHKSIEKLFLKKPPRKQQVNDFYFNFFFCTKLFCNLMVMNCNLKLPSLEKGNLVKLPSLEQGNLVLSS